MSEITVRIAAIIGSHEYWQHPDKTWECACGSGYGLKVNLDTHVAQVIAEQVGLTKETRTNVMSSCGMTTDYRTGVTTTHSDIRYDRRYTTPWEAE